MKKSKVLGIALTVAMVSSIAATAAISASAKVSADGIEGDTVGITGSFCNWGNTGETDVPMTNNNGVWEGTISIDNVTKEMTVDQATKDDGKGTQVPRTDVVGTAITFKIRTNGNWDDSWGDFEPDFARSWNSQTNCAVAATIGQPITIKVKLDTTKYAEGNTVDTSDPKSVKKGWKQWAVSYEVVPSETSTDPTPVESSEESTTPVESSETPAESTPAVESSEESTTPATGDTTSAVALVAVVIASLGAAVVMTKKASAKD